MRHFWLALIIFLCILGFVTLIELFPAIKDYLGPIGVLIYGFGFIWAALNA